MARVQLHSSNATRIGCVCIGWRATRAESVRTGLGSCDGATTPNPSSAEPTASTSAYTSAYVLHAYSPYTAFTSLEPGVIRMREPCEYMTMINVENGGKGAGTHDAGIISRQAQTSPVRREQVLNMSGVESGRRTKIVCSITYWKPSYSVDTSSKG